MRLVANQQPIQKVPPNSAHDVFRNRVRLRRDPDSCVVPQHERVVVAGANHRRPSPSNCPEKQVIVRIAADKHRLKARVGALTREEMIRIR
jgi:hypothetical protein